jgi:hypothetical protein
VSAHGIHFHIFIYCLPCELVTPLTPPTTAHALPKRWPCLQACSSTSHRIASHHGRLARSPQPLDTSDHRTAVPFKDPIARYHHEKPSPNTNRGGCRLSRKLSFVSRTLQLRSGQHAGARRFAATSASCCTRDPSWQEGIHSFVRVSLTAAATSHACVAYAIWLWSGNRSIGHVLPSNIVSTTPSVNNNKASAVEATNCQ